MANRLAKVLAGRRLEAASFAAPDLAPYGRRLVGRTVRSVTSRSKALLTEFDGDLTMYSHNQLYGRWFVVRRGREPATNRSLRVALHTATHSALLYSATDIAMLTSNELARHPYLVRLGPEALDESVEWRDIAARLGDSGFRGRRLSALYLDQGFVAGIGNYLRSEILFDAGVNPSARPTDLTRGEIGRLARSTLKVTRRALATAGVTNPPRRVASLQKRGAPRRDYRFAVFERDGAQCYQCGGTVRRVEAGSRRLYFCGECQGAA